MTSPIITFWPSLTATQGHRKELPWATILEGFSTPVEGKSKDALPGWSLASFRNDRRRKDAVELVYALVLDDDSGKTPLAQLAYQWEGVKGFAFTTWSSTPDANRHRTVLPLSRPVTPAEYTRIWTWARDYCRGMGQTIDEKVCDPSRLWFVPALRPGGHFETLALEGTPLNADDLLTLCPAAPVTPAASTISASSVSADRVALAREYLRKEPGAVTGEHGGTNTFTLAQRVGVGFDLDEDTTYELLAEEWNDRCEPPWDERGLRRKVREAFEKGTTVQRGSLLPGAFETLDADTLFAPLPEPRYVIQGLLREGSLLYWAAYGSSSKTWQGLDAAVAVALGQPWLHRFATVRGRVAIVDYESGQYELRRRLQLIAKARGVDTVPGLEAVVMPGMYMGTPKFYTAMERLADGRALVVLDSLRAASLEDENDSRIRKGLDDLRSIAEKTGCAFGLLVHAKKSSGTPGTIDDREILRGSSAVFDAADVVLASFYQTEEECFDSRQCKARQGRAVDPFRVRVEDAPKGIVIRAEDMPNAEEVERQRDIDLAVAIRAYVAEHPGCYTKQVEARVKGRASSIRAALAELVEEGVLSEQKEGSTRRYWAVGNLTLAVVPRGVVGTTLGTTVPNDWDDGDDGP